MKDVTYSGSSSVVSWLKNTDYDDVTLSLPRVTILHATLVEASIQFGGLPSNLAFLQTVTCAHGTSVY